MKSRSDKFLTPDPPESMLPVAESMNLETVSSHISEGICEVQTALARMLEASQSTIPLKLSLTPANLAAAYRIAKETVSEEWKLQHVSMMNAIPAYLVHALNAVSSDPPLRYLFPDLISHIHSFHTNRLSLGNSTTLSAFVRNNLLARSPASTLLQKSPR